jgi:5-methylcytosine-specific restriction endonuclease McrA
MSECTASVGAEGGMMLTSEVKRSKVNAEVRVRVWARAAGRCVLCARYLIDSRFNFLHDAQLVGQIAHIVAAEGGPKAPRGDASLTSAERAREENLLLLCPDCHLSVDNLDNVGRFNVEWLQQRKVEHEERVRRATSFETLHRTLVVTTSGPIRGSHVRVSDRQISEALIDAGLVVHVEDGAVGHITIELDGDLASDYAWRRTRDIIDDRIEKLTGIHDTASRKPDHISVFALAPIPSLVYLGSRLDDKISIKVFDHRRGEGDKAWCWPPQAVDPAQFGVTPTHATDPGARDVVAILNVSATVHEKNVPAKLAAYPAILLSPADETPRAGLIGSEVSLNNAADAWIQLLGQVEALWPGAERIHLLAAIPASLAVRVGTHRMRDAQPDLVTYQLTDAGYEAAITISDKQSTGGK